MVLETEFGDGEMKKVAVILNVKECMTTCQLAPLVIRSTLLTLNVQLAYDEITYQQGMNVNATADRGKFPCTHAW
jgi:hypothetical protein